jgi:multidrug efflux system outer membrane protein
VRIAALAAGLAVAVSAANCTGTAGPDYRRPDLDLPAAMPGAGSSQSAAPRDDWWRTFGDAELDRLVADARKGNLDLRAMEGRIRAARAVAERSGSSAKPHLDAGGSYLRSRTSENSVSSRAARFADVGDPDDVEVARLSASWEPDLFGRVRRGVEAAWADAAAVEEDRRSMEVALVADVAEAWFDVGEADAEAALNRETVALLEETLGLVKTRVDAGLVSELDLRRTEGDLATARSRIPGIERRRAVAENRLSLLLGKPPGVKATGRPPASFELPAEVPVGLPGQLLARRPDVRAAERRLVATNARVGEAIADFYPRFQITGFAGYSSISPDDLFRWASRIWAIEPSVTLPILDGGEREFRKIEAEALRDAQTAEWTGTLVRALNEVGDALVSLAADRRTRDAVKVTVAAQARSVELSSVRYREGITSYIDVLDAQQALAFAKLTLLAAERRIVSDYVELHRALGGGWTGSARAADDPPDRPVEQK